MARKEAIIAADGPAEFPVMLAEFLTELPAAQVEMKAAFARLAQKQGLTGSKLRKDWNELYEKFRTLPVGADWKTWTASKEEATHE